MRFAASLVVASLALTLASRAVASPSSESQPAPTEAVARSSNPAADPSLEPTPPLIPEPTPRPSPRPTPKQTATPTPEPTPALGEAPRGDTRTGTVVSVVDGDTIDVLVAGAVIRVRLIGIDTPEVHSGVEWMGPEAHAAMARLVDGKEVVLERDVSKRDQFGRSLRHVWVADGGGWMLVNAELVRRGFAIASSYPPDTAYDTLYRSMQDRAQAAGRARWGPTPTPVPTPVPTAAPIAPLVPSHNCEASYPDVCIPLGSADIDCGEIAARLFTVLWNVANPDPHGFDGDSDGIGCES